MESVMDAGAPPPGPGAQEADRQQLPVGPLICVDPHNKGYSQQETWWLTDYAFFLLYFQAVAAVPN
jgi:hypothetical protein